MDGVGKRRSAGAAALMILLGAFWFVMPTAVFASSVEPIAIGSNANCEGLTGIEELLRIDPGASGHWNVVIDGNTYGIDVDVKADNTFDWWTSGGLVIYAVFVKGGPGGGGNLYDYRPGGATSDSGLHALAAGSGYAGLSHITFCGDEEEPTTSTSEATTSTSEATTSTSEATTTTVEQTTTSTSEATTTTVPETTTSTSEATTTTEPETTTTIEETTTTSEAESTTTTMAETTTTAEVLGTTTSAPTSSTAAPTTATVGGKQVEELPMTGIDHMTLAGAAAVLMIAGFSLSTWGRKRAEGEGGETL